MGKRITISYEDSVVITEVFDLVIEEELNHFSYLSNKIGIDLLKRLRAKLFQPSISPDLKKPEVERSA